MHIQLIEVKIYRRQLEEELHHEFHHYQMLQLGRNESSEHFVYVY